MRLILLSLICFLSLAGASLAQDVTITNLTQLADVAFSANYSLYLPWTPWQIQAYPTDNGEPWWVDCSQADCADLLSTSTNACATLQMHGITVTFATLTENILTGETLVQSGCSTNVIASIAAPSSYEPGTQLGYNAWVWRQWQQITNCLDCWGLAANEIPPPIVTLRTRLADAAQYSTYASNEEAEAEAAAAAWASATTASGDARATGAGRFMAMDDDDVSCTITDETLPFSVTQIEQDGSGNTWLTWTSCSDHIYGVFSSADLSNWVGIAAMWGDDLSTTREDTNTAGGVAIQFYKIVRIPPDEGYNGDAIPSGWAVDNGLNPLDPNLDIEDPDNDFWNNLAEYQNGTDPNNSASLAPYSFTINGGTDETTNAQVQLGFPGLVADYVIISESITMTNGVTNSFVSPLTYTLLNTNDGLHTIYLQLLKTSGTLSPVFGRTTELDTHQPTISITSPTNGVTVSQRLLNIEGFAADASTTNAAVSDANRALLVTVNGDFVNDRDTNGLWWSAQDLTPGTNTFVAVATDRAGWTVTNSVWFIYDPTLATNMPVLTVDVTNTITVASNATTIAVSGTIDDGNATIQIDVLDAVDNTITNATVSAAVIGTNWWAEVPVVAGSNLVVVSAANAASPATTNSFTIIQSTNVFLEIDSPVADTDVNATNVLVVGHASANFDASITINGVPANTSLDISGITFNNSVPINSVDANTIEVDATGTDGSSATARETVYGYEVTTFHQVEEDDFGLVGSDCWFAYHYPDTYEFQSQYHAEDTWALPSSQVSYGWDERDYSYSGLLLPSSESGGAPYDWDPSILPIGDPGSVTYHSYLDAKHVDASRSDGIYNCPYDHDCTNTCPDGADCECHDLGFCLGDSTTGCCIDTKEEDIETDQFTHEITFVKHWPVNEEQTVILHFQDFYYWLRAFGPGAETSQNPNFVTLWGKPAVIYDIESAAWGLNTNLGFVVKIKTNTRYTLRDTDFVVPRFDMESSYGPNAQSVGHVHVSGQAFGYDSFANVKPVVVISQGTNAVPSTGVLVKTGDVLDIKLQDGSSISNNLVWYSRQLNRDGTFTTWTDFGAQGHASEFLYTTPAGGIYQIKAAYTGGTGSNEFIYVRSQNAAHASDSGGLYNPIYNKGQPDYVGVADTDIQIAVRQQALINLGNAAYAKSANLVVQGDTVVGSGTNKCNIFVYHKAGVAFAPVPLTRGGLPGFRTSPPLAYDWWDTTYAITGWPRLSDDTPPQPGYVIARPDPHVLISGDPDYGKRWAHVGILDYDGGWIQAGTRDVNKYPHLTMPEWQPLGMRNYTGD